MYEQMTMRYSRHGEVETFRPLPGTAPICRQCCDERDERARIDAEGLSPVRAQLDRIEAKLDQLLSDKVRFLKVYDWDTGSIERIREGGSSYGFDGSVSAP